MRDLLGSMSLTGGAIVAAVASAIAAVLFLRIRRVHVSVLAALLFPFAFATILYWSPVLLGSGSEAEYSAWAPIFIFPVAKAGLAAASAVVLAGTLWRVLHRPRSAGTPPDFNFEPQHRR